MIWPYEEVLAQFTGDQMTLSTPWLSVTVKTKIKLETQNKFAECLLNGPKKLIDMVVVNKLCAPFESYPFFYTFPRAELTPDESELMNADISSVINSSKLGVTWPMDEILKKARIAEDQYDLVSVLSSIRRYHLLNMSTLADEYSMSQILPLIFAAQSLKALSFLVSQNHQMANQLSASDEFLDEAADNLKDQTKEIAKLETLRNFTEVSMELSKNPLAKAFLMDLTERNVFSSKDPIADMLVSMGQKKAAESLAKHRQSRLDKAASLSAIKNLNAMGSVTEAYAKQSIEAAYTLADLYMKFVIERAQKALALANLTEQAQVH